MRTGHHHLFVPGPTNVPDCVQRAMAVPMQDHRAPEAGALTRGIRADLKPVFGTRSAEILLFPGSGTAAWEAAITNTLSPGDKVLMARHGQFSSLWIRMAERLGLEVTVVEAGWGAGAPVAEFDRILGNDTHGDIKAVFVTHNETSTGVTSDIAGVRQALDSAFHDALLFVDGVSSIGAVAFEMDTWGVDLAVAGSQKALMLPPGLGLLAVSRKALSASREALLPRAYFEFADLLAMHADGYFPYTPPIQLLHGLRRALDRLQEEGLDAVHARHARLAAAVRAAVAAWGLDIVAMHPARASDTVTAIRVPGHVDAREVIRIAREKYNAAFGSGLGELEGQVFRIGHLGDLNEGMVLTALSLAELAMAEAGVRIHYGSGVAAAQAVFHPPRALRPELRLAAE